MIKHRYIIYGVNNKGEFLRGTCLDYDMIHCIKVCEKQNIKIHKIEQFNFEESDLPMGIEKIEKVKNEGGMAMSDREALIIIVDYLEALEKDLFVDYNTASDDIKPVISAKVSVISKLIDHIESATGIEVRMCD